MWFSLGKCCFSNSSVSNLDYTPLGTSSILKLLIRVQIISLERLKSTWLPLSTFKNHNVFHFNFSRYSVVTIIFPVRWMIFIFIKTVYTLPWVPFFGRNSEILLEIRFHLEVHFFNTGFGNPYSRKTGLYIERILTFGIGLFLFLWEGWIQSIKNGCTFETWTVPYSWESLG